MKTHLIIASDPDPKGGTALGIRVDMLSGYDDADPVAALRSAAAEFLATDAGAKALASANGAFNWGDLAEHLTGTEFPGRHGVLILDTFTTGLVVDHDEDLTGGRP